MTKELLQARQKELEGLISDQRSIQASLRGEIQRLETQHRRSQDMENTLGGAKQECGNMLKHVLDAEKAAQGADGKTPDPKADQGGQGRTM